MNRKKEPHSSEVPASDDELFRSAVADAAPLAPSRNVAHRKNPPLARPRMKEADEQAVMNQLLDPTPEWLDDFECSTGESLNYRREGVQLATMKKLRRGHYRLDDELDLHGQTIASAKQALSEFLSACMSRNRRCVRIIHGKGNRSGRKGPVLKPRVDYWLRQREEVLAFCSARPEDGGTGAVVVLLRRSR